jgi:phospholipid/cholesterol/gamma-HCH transport system permease protein
MSLAVVTGPARVAGSLFAFTLDVVAAVFRRPFQIKEFLQQAWFIVTV